MWELDPKLRSLLVCPICRGELTDVGRGLLCLTDDRLFPVVDNRPHVVEELAVTPTKEEREEASR